MAQIPEKRCKLWKPMYRPGALSGITGLKQGGSLWEKEEKKTGVSSSNIPRRPCLVSPSYFSSPGTYTFRKSLPAPGKPQWSKAEEKSSFLFAQGYPKTELEKKSVHGKIKNIWNISLLLYKTDKLCDLRHIVKSFWASVSSSIRVIRLEEVTLRVVEWWQQRKPKTVRV